MKFGPVPLTSALGHVLAHSRDLPGRRLRKGEVLQEQDLADLAASGVTTVTVARLEPDDVGEDVAAETLAAALVPDPNSAGIRISRAATGRVNLFATAPGVVRLDPERINAVNAVDPMITLATLPPFHRVAAGTMLATVKIISYAVSQSDLSRACAAAQPSPTDPALCVARVKIKSARLIQTRVSSQDTGAKGQAVTAARLDRMGVPLAPVCVVPHEEEALARAITDSDQELILILTGSATSDIDDVAPVALRRAKGELRYFGMPVDPGNLLFIGHVDRPKGRQMVIGLPGCARSPALNGADWVLERLLCGVDVSPGMIQRMGVGGLLKEIPDRPRPRQG